MSPHCFPQNGGWTDCVGWRPGRIVHPDGPGWDGRKFWRTCQKSLRLKFPLIGKKKKEVILEWHEVKP